MQHKPCEVLKLPTSFDVPRVRGLSEEAFNEGVEVVRAEPFRPVVGASVKSELDLCRVGSSRAAKEAALESELRVSSNVRWGSKIAYFFREHCACALRRQGKEFERYRDEP